jgi:hypothetical protein
MPRALLDQLSLDTDAAGALRAVHEAAAIDGWRITAEGGDRMTLEEVPGQARPSTFPARVGLNVVSAPGGRQTLIQLDAFGVGVGRIQRGHLYARVEELKYAIGACAARQRSQPAGGLADEIRELSEQRDQGAISEEEFAARKARLLGS